MKLYTVDNAEMMDVSKIEVEDSKLLINGTIMGAMPVRVMLTGSELRKAIRLLNLKVIFTAIRMLMSK